MSYNEVKNRIVDVFKELTCWQYQTQQMFPNAKLENVAKIFGVNALERENQCSGKDFAEYYFCDDPLKNEKAYNHLLADLYETHALYHICKGG